MRQRIVRVEQGLFTTATLTAGTIVCGSQFASGFFRRAQELNADRAVALAAERTAEVQGNTMAAAQAAHEALIDRASANSSEIAGILSIGAGGLVLAAGAVAG